MYIPYIHIYIYTYIHTYIHIHIGPQLLGRRAEPPHPRGHARPDLPVEPRDQRTLRPISLLTSWISEGLTQA